MIIHKNREQIKDDILYLKKFSKESEKQLISCGVPPQDLPIKRTSIDVEKSLVHIDPDIPGVPTRSISPAKQYAILNSLLEHPLRSSYSIGISSFPSDARAKYLALAIMEQALITYKENPRKRAGRVPPIWHRVYGGYNDPLRDKFSDIPCMLIISNVNVDSTPIKIEKVRDLLEKFSNVPRIIVTGGEPPCNLFIKKLHFPMRAGLYIGPDNFVRNMPS